MRSFLKASLLSDTLHGRIDLLPLIPIINSYYFVLGFTIFIPVYIYSIYKGVLVQSFLVDRIWKFIFLERISVGRPKESQN